MITYEVYENLLDELSYKDKMEQCILSLLSISNSSELTEEDIVKRIINEVQTLTSSSCGYLHLFDHKTQTIDLKVWSDSTLEHCTAVYEHQYPLESAGIWADCARTGKPVIHNDYATEPNKKGLPEGHFHIERHLSIPVIEDGECKVIIGVGNKLSDYDENDIRYMSVVANNLWNLIQTKRYANKLKKLNEEARYDFLTRTFVRKEFERLLYSLTQSSYETDHHVISYFDLDSFKIINDTYGHKVGDEVLKFFIDVIRKYVRQSDYICRLGGDEFSVIFKDVKTLNVKKICQMILDHLSTHSFIHHDIELKICCSIGLCEFSNDDPEQIMINVDTACYMAKENGKHQIRVYNKSNEVYVARKNELDILNNIPILFSHDKLRLFIQPIQCLQTVTNSCHICKLVKDTCVSRCQLYEVLLRIYDNFTLFPPSRYFKVAEKYNMMQKIDEWVIINILKILDSEQYSCKISSVFINLSSQSIQNYSFCQFLENEIKKSKRAHNICFEITETIAIKNLEQTKQLISKLKKYGCKFALDDFGSGFCSFKYLYELPIDFIKIDGIFIEKINKDPFSELLVKSIQDIARYLDISVIAECVSSFEIYEKVKELDIDFAQGFYIKQPHDFNHLNCIL
jgi:diguanylate cyclase (GGDEF)-like protein